MIIREVNGDVTAPVRGIIGHGVNCQGVMGSGVALAIRNKYPVVFEKYKEFCDAAESPEQLLGQVQMVEIQPDLYVANMFTQLSFGRDGQAYASSEALIAALHRLRLKRQDMIVERIATSSAFMGMALEGISEAFMQTDYGPKVNGLTTLLQERSVAGSRRSQFLCSIYEAVADLNEVYPEDDQNTRYELEIFLPRIASGLGGLAWEDVKPMIDQHTVNSPVTIYHFS